LKLFDLPTFSRPTQKCQNAKLGIKDCLGLFLNLMKLNDEDIAATSLQNEQKKDLKLKKSC
jgi:hypothetical protein